MSGNKEVEKIKNDLGEEIKGVLLDVAKMVKEHGEVAGETMTELLAACTALQIDLTTKASTTDVKTAIGAIHKIIEKIATPEDQTPMHKKLVEIEDQFSKLRKLREDMQLEIDKIKGDLQSTSTQALQTKEALAVLHTDYDLTKNNVTDLKENVSRSLNSLAATRQSLQNIINEHEKNMRKIQNVGNKANKHFQSKPKL